MLPPPNHYVMIRPCAAEVVDPVLKSFSQQPPERTVWSPASLDALGKTH